MAIKRDLIEERLAFELAQLEVARVADEVRLHQLRELRRDVAGVRRDLAVAVDWRDASNLRNRRRCVRIESDAQAIGELAARTLLDTDRYASYAYHKNQGSRWKSGM